MDEKTIGRLRFVINTAYWAVVAALAWLALKYVAGWILPFLLAFAIVSIVHPMIRMIKRKLHIEREIVSLIIMLLIYAAFFSLLVLLIIQLVMLLRDMLAGLPEYYENTLRPGMVSAGDFIARNLQRLPESWQLQFEDFQGTLLSTVQTMLLDLSQRGLSGISSISARVPVFVIALIFTVMLSFFISMQYRSVTAFMRRLLPQSIESQLERLKRVMQRTVVQYLRAVLTLMMITACELSVGLLLLRTPNAILIALGIAVFDALPFFGTGAVMIPWTLFELLQGNLTYGVSLGILYGIVTLVRNIIEPKIIGDKLGLNPIVSLISIYLGFRTFGVLGMIFMPILVQILLALHQEGSFPWLERYIPIQRAKQTTPPTSD